MATRNEQFAEQVREALGQVDHATMGATGLAQLAGALMSRAGVSRRTAAAMASQLAEEEQEELAELLDDVDLVEGA